jgi:hypothetical protein
LPGCRVPEGSGPFVDGRGGVHAQTGELLAENEIHEEKINDMQFSLDGTHFITASQDRTAKLVDTQTLEVLKTYKTTAPVNAAAISPVFDHVVLGGGQEAAQVGAICTAVALAVQARCTLCCTGFVNIKPTSPGWAWLLICCHSSKCAPWPSDVQPV